MENKELHWADIVTIVLYFVVCIGIGIWSARKTNLSSAKGYFLAGKGMGWLPVGASIFSTNVGSQFFIGMAGTAAVSGIAVIIFEWHAVYSILLLAWLYLPVYVTSGTYTTPGFLKKRFGGRRLRLYLSILSMALYIMQRVSVAMYSGGVFIQQAVGWDIYFSSFLVIVITAAYTITGGLAAVIYADTMQTIVMIAGSAVLTVMGFIEVGGANGLYTRYNAAVPNVSVVNNVTCGLPREDAWHILRHPVDSDFPWPAVTFGLTVPAVFVWCNDQVMVQRVLAAKNLAHAQGGAILGSYLKLLPMLMIVLPGMISRALYPNEVACVDPDICEAVCQNRAGCSNIAYPILVLKILPSGLRGLMLASMLAALMSTLTSIFNSSSSMFTLDIWRQIRKKASNMELMIVGRLFIIVLVVLSYVWIPILQTSSGAQLWVYLQAVAANLLPPWFVVFACGVFWKRTNEKGAFWSLMVGLVAGVIRMVLDFVYPEPSCGFPDTRPYVLAKVHYLYFALILTGICLMVIIPVSLLTAPLPEKKLRRVTFWTRNSEPREDSDDEDDVIENSKEPAVDTPGEVSAKQLSYRYENKGFRHNAVEDFTHQDNENGHAKQKNESPADSNEMVEMILENVEAPAVKKEEARWKHYLKVACGMTHSSEEPPKATEDDLRDYMNMDRKAKIILTANVIVLICVATFLIGYFG
ncbi:sodium/mannose cotransporter SLC5A10-like [Lineus longissimus]|uniref:sodium/mannose cotransporter SLC5A10-like n=1 Tax=Lineus longissimus TaxID=88925 RepID=UPI002B4EA672